MDPERIKIDPRELEALQRAAESLANIDSDPSPEIVQMAEVPAAAEQPAAFRPLPAPEEPVDVPVVAAPDLLEAPEPLLNDLPDLNLSALPKPNAWQKRHGQVVVPPEPVPEPPPRQKQPDEQPPQAVGPDLRELMEEARRLGNLDEKDRVVNWDRNIGQENGQRIGGADANENDLREALKDNAERTNAIFVTMIELLREQSGRIQRLELEVKRILTGMERSRG